MERRRLVETGLAVLMCVVLSVCNSEAPPQTSSGDAPPASTSVGVPARHTRIHSLTIHDKKPDKAGVTIERIDLHIVRIELIATNGDKILVSDQEANINLLDFTSDNAFQLLDQFKDVPSQSYEQLRFVTTGNNTITVSTTAGTSTEPLKLPSGDTSGFKLNIAGADQTFGDGCMVSLDVDIDPDKDIVIAGNKYILKPTHKVAVSPLCPGGDFEVVKGTYHSATGLTLASSDGSVALTIPPNTGIATRDNYTPSTDLAIAMRIYDSPNASALPAHLLAPEVQAASAPIDRVIELLPHGLVFDTYPQLTVQAPGAPLLLHGCRVSGAYEIIDCAIYESVHDTVDVQPAYALDIPGFFALAQLSDVAAIQNVLQAAITTTSTPNTPQKPKPSLVQNVALAGLTASTISLAVDGVFNMGQACGKVQGCFGACCLCQLVAGLCVPSPEPASANSCGPGCNPQQPPLSQLEVYYAFGPNTPSSTSSMVSVTAVDNAQSYMIDIPRPPGPLPGQVTLRTRTVNQGFSSVLSNFETATVSGTPCANCTIEQQPTATNCWGFDSTIIKHGQSFTAGISGNIVQIDMALHLGNESNPAPLGQVALVIFEGAGFGGTTLHSELVTPSYDPDPVTVTPLESFAMSTPVPVVAGQTYTIGLSTSGPDYGRFCGIPQDLYPGGSAYFGSNAFPQHDAAFAVYIAP